jgi:entry exclusion lipoprotein TrbK
MRTTNVLMLAALIAATLTGCNGRPGAAMPEVNDENCQIEKIKQIEDKETREAFAGLCAHRSVGIAPTKKPKNWLDLTDQKR